MACSFFLLEIGKPDVCSELRGSANLFGHWDATVIFTAGPMCQRGVAAGVTEPCKQQNWDSWRSSARQIPASGWPGASAQERKRGGRHVGSLEGRALI